uniref:DEK_C domain-containing protein n=1 Tax=Rhabditophanes sp. KR3021 TaxID=114890 RepID=A0AC35TSA7_9BILA
MAENLFDSFSFNLWHNHLRGRAVEEDEKKEIKKQLKKIAARLDGERDLRLQLGGINDVDIARLLHYLKFNEIRETEEAFEDDSGTSNWERRKTLQNFKIKLDDLNINEILAILNMRSQKKTSSISSTLDVKTLKWKHNKRLVSDDDAKGKISDVGGNSKLRKMADPTNELKFRYNKPTVVKPNKNENDDSQGNENDMASSIVDLQNKLKFKYNKSVKGEMNLDEKKDGEHSF